MVSDTNSNIRLSLIFENFAGTNFRESPLLKNFAGINFRESTFSGVKKGIYFANLAKIREISKKISRENFFP